MKTFPLTTLSLPELELDATCAVYDEIAGTLSLTYEDDSPEIVSVVLSDTPAGEGRVWIKDWSEHHGMAAALAEAGVLTVVGSTLVGPFDSTALLCQIA